MARDRKKHVCETEVLIAAPPSSAVSPAAPLATALPYPHHRDQILALVRALARDSARVDHDLDLAANPDDQKANK